MFDPRSEPSAEWIAGVRERYPVERTVDSALTRKLLRRSQPMPPRSDRADLGARLQAFVARRTSEPFEIRNLRPLSGGASKEQYVFEIDWSLGGERRVGERMVLGRDPWESIVVTDRRREFQLLKAIEGIIPAPRAYWVDATGEELGQAAIVCGFVDGVQKPPASKSNVTGMGVQFDAEHRAALAPQFIDYLARIHNCDLGSADLSAFDMPTVGTTEDIDRQINWWARIWEEDRLEPVPLMNLAEQWLRKNRKPLDKVSLVHGDYRTGNFLFDPDSKQITTILDWELGYFGDRHFDLGWATMLVFRTPDEDGNMLYSSLYSRENFLGDYERASGLKVDPERLRYYEIFAHWRGITMPLGAGPRVAAGLKTHQDVVLTWFAGLSYPLLESLRRLLESA